MFGSHLSVAGGMMNALTSATELGFDTVQVFTKNQRQWKAPALKDSETRDWLSGLKDRGWERRTVSHATYLMNCASPDAELFKKSAAMLIEELNRCAALSIPFLVAHPGSHLGEGVEKGAARIGKAAAEAFRKGAGVAGAFRVTLCLENTAGGGATMGRTFEELALVKKAIDEASQGDADGRVGFCVDTCHALAAGYDLRGGTPAKATGAGRERQREACRAVLNEFDRVCGLGLLRVLHLNDSKGALGSRLDRHTHLGMGEVGLGAFQEIVSDARLRDVPMILETPKEDDEKGRAWDTVNLGVLRRLAKG